MQQQIRRRWMTQIARNLTDLNDGFLRGKRYLILDRDTKYSDAFRSVLVREGIQVVRLPTRSPNLNAFAERFVRSIKASRFAFEGHLAPASKVDKVRIGEEYAAPSGSLALIGREPSHSGSERCIQGKFRTL
jgi:transposase InsO family protein